MSLLDVSFLKALATNLAPALMIATLLPCSQAEAQSIDQPVLQKELVIATKEAPPFVMKRADGSFYGISIDLWRQIAGQLHLRYRFTQVDTVQNVLDGTAHGSFDAAIAALTATAARERAVDFTQPFY